MFLHGGIWHLLFNMLTLWFFGTQLERDWGTRQFLKYYFLLRNRRRHLRAGRQHPAGRLAHPHHRRLRARFSASWWRSESSIPNQTVLMSFLFPIKAKYLVMIYAAIELLMTFGPNNGVSTIAHLGGMAFGYVYLKGRLPKVRMPDLGGAYRQWKLARAKKKFQVYMRKHGNGPWVN